MNEKSSTKFLINLFEPKPYNLDIIQINLDETDLGLADVLRNTNRVLPINSRDRNSISSGFKVVGILCTSKLLAPMSGLLLFLVGDGVVSSIATKKYITMVINEKRISSEKEISVLIDDITMYMISEYRDTLSHFEDFYKKFIFDDYNDEFYDY